MRFSGAYLRSDSVCGSRWDADSAFIPERALVEVTCRTIQGRFLLKPFPGWREIFVGALVKAQALHPVEIKEHLVKRVADWPGPHCGAALVAGEPVDGIWPNRTRQWLARHSGQKFTREELEEPCTLVLEPLPCWRGSTVEHRQASVREILEEIAAEAVNTRRDGGWPCLGAHAVLKQDPHGRPVSSKRSPAPYCHAFTKRVRRRLRRAYGLFCAAYREAASRLAVLSQKVGHGMK